MPASPAAPPGRTAAAGVLPSHPALAEVGSVGVVGVGLAAAAVLI